MRARGQERHGVGHTARQDALNRPRTDPVAPIIRVLRQGRRRGAPGRVALPSAGLIAGESGAMVLLTDVTIVPVHLRRWHIGDAVPCLIN